MNYADIKRVDVANGPGVRVSLFVSGCTHKCKGCFNSVAWDFNYGIEFTEETIEKIIEYLRPSYIAGLSLLGGEPFEPENQEGLLPLLRKVKAIYPEKNIWCYSGYLYDVDIIDRMCEESEITKEIVSYIDMIVDGKFDESLKSLNIKFRGSTNQRIIDVKESRKEQRVVLWSGMEQE